MIFGWNKKNKKEEIEEQTEENASGVEVEEEEVKASEEDVQDSTEEVEASEEDVQDSAEEVEASEEDTQASTEKLEDTGQDMEEPAEKSREDEQDSEKDAPACDSEEEMTGEEETENEISDEEENPEDNENSEEGEQEPQEKKQGFFSRLVAGLTKTRDSFVSGIDSIFSGFSAIDEDFYEEIEEILIMGDIGVRATEEILDSLKEKVKEKHIKQPQECKELLIQSIKEQMEVGETAYRFEEEKSVVLIVGVNGVGKTTSVGKLAGKLKDQGRKVVLAAADTFRAAAGAQLEEWAHRAGVDMIGGQEGADPAAVVYDAVAAAKARKADVLLCDTAGRLHNKKNLMEELKKINRILEKEYPDAFRETLVVLDGTTGQNALAQAKQFMEVAEITGIILTKMDGTAKGGIAVAIQSELGIPVKYIGVGETIEDLQKFDSEQFVDALFAIREE